MQTRMGDSLGAKENSCAEMGEDMTIKCIKKLEFIINEYDAETLMEICSLAQLIIEGKSKGTLPIYMEKERINKFIGEIFEKGS